MFLQQVSALRFFTQDVTLPARLVNLHKKVPSNLSVDAAPLHLNLPKNPFNFELEGYQVVFEISGTDSFSSAAAGIFAQQVFLKQMNDHTAAGWQRSHELPSDGISLVSEAGEPHLWWYMNQRAISEPKMKLTYYLLEIALYDTIQLVQAYGDEMCRAYRISLVNLRVETDLLASGEMKRWPLSMTAE
ncbi:hypothetical protein N7G274_001499 [Stereocaulon virgatum]|uniref:Uncharacterized protein n=1 Tax=Stereocaulon virgatum TaxID=373712 RepID=A0ABR4AMW0_9LECA